ncbi:MAG: YfhO family protein [Oligoflexales bacterium]|nr:YfhO family protein [Oligoflexales bacterium]
MNKNIQNILLVTISFSIIIAVLYGDVFIHADSIMTHDTINWYASFNYFILSLAQGHLPLWDPFSYSGAPFYLNPSIVGVMDPITLLTIPFVSLGNLSALKVYHLHFLLRLLIYCVGSFFLYELITRNFWASLIGALVSILFMAPNAFWQHGSMVMVTYVPLITFFVLMILKKWFIKKKAIFAFIAANYLIGISFNLYYAVYLLVFISLIILYALLSRMLSPITFLKIFRTIGLRNVIIGTLTFLVMAGPFIVTAMSLLPEKGENFSMARFEQPVTSDTMVHDSSIVLWSPENPSRSSFHNLINGFFPWPDTSYFTSGLPHPFTEQFCCLGTVPIILCFLFLLKAKGFRYKGLFIFLTIIIGLLIFGPPWLYEKILRFYPGVSSIRQLYNFLGFFVLCWGALISISLTEAIKIYKFNELVSRHWLGALYVLFFSQIIYIFVYLKFVKEKSILSPILYNHQYFINLTSNVGNYGWLLILSYILVGSFLYINIKPLRMLSLVFMISLTIFELSNFNVKLKPFTIQPAALLKNEIVHYNRKFEYDPIRVPFVSRYATFWGFLPALYRIPSAIPPYFNDYMNIIRRAYDLIRFIPINTQKVISGIGSRRFGFFNKYFLVENGVQSLNLLAQLPVEELKEVLILEENPKRFLDKTELSSLEEINLSTRKLYDTLNDPFWRKRRGIYHYIAEFYDQREFINFHDTKNYLKNSYLNIPIPESSVANNWPWDLKHLGYFHILFGNLETNYYQPFAYYPNPALRLSTDQSFCYCDLKEWYTKHAVTGLSPNLYEQYPYSCDIKIDKNSLLISPNARNLQTSDVLDDYLPKQKSGALSTGFTIVSLDPKKVTSEQSILGRNEELNIIEFGPNSMTFSVKNTKSGLFYYADSYSDDWSATLDDKKVHIFKTNFNYKAIFVPEGSHTISMKFRPTLFFLSFWLFIFGSIIGLIIFSLVLSKKISSTQEVSFSHLFRNMKNRPKHPNCNM